MKFLLDENFPLPLNRRLREQGHDAEHLIELGKRGIPDSEIRRRLESEELVFLTHDAEFEDIPADLPSQVIISRLPQRLPTVERVEIWLKALNSFVERKPPERLFDLLPGGEIVAWQIIDLVRNPPRRE